METRILVPLIKRDQIEEIIPYLETVTQPDTRVVFLIHHPANGLKWLQAYCGIMECGLEKTLALRRMVESYSMSMRSQLARQKVFETCETLHQLRAKMTVEVYRGSLRKLLRSYVNSGDVDLIVTRPRFRFMSSLHGTAAVLSMPKRPSSSLLLRSQPHSESTLPLLYPGV